MQLMLRTFLPSFACSKVLLMSTEERKGRRAEKKRLQKKPAKQQKNKQKRLGKSRKKLKEHRLRSELQKGTLVKLVRREA